VFLRDVEAKSKSADAAERQSAVCAAEEDRDSQDEIQSYRREN
jgi:hypothetical protein